MARKDIGLEAVNSQRRIKVEAVVALYAQASGLLQKQVRQKSRRLTARRSTGVANVTVGQTITVLTVTKPRKRWLNQSWVAM